MELPQSCSDEPNPTWLDQEKSLCSIDPWTYITWSHPDLYIDLAKKCTCMVFCLSYGLTRVPLLHLIRKIEEFQAVSQAEYHYWDLSRAHNCLFPDTYLTCRIGCNRILTHTMLVLLADSADFRSNFRPEGCYLYVIDNTHSLCMTRNSRQRLIKISKTLSINKNSVTVRRTATYIIRIRT